MRDLRQAAAAAVNVAIAEYPQYDFGNDGTPPRRYTRRPAVQIDMAPGEADYAALVEDIYSVANQPASGGPSRAPSTPSIACSGIYDVGLHREVDIYGRRASVLSALSWDNTDIAELQAGVNGEEDVYDLARAPLSPDVILAAARAGTLVRPSRAEKGEVARINRVTKRGSQLSIDWDFSGETLSESFTGTDALARRIPNLSPPCMRSLRLNAASSVSVTRSGGTTPSSRRSALPRRKSPARRRAPPVPRVPLPDMDARGIE